MIDFGNEEVIYKDYYRPLKPRGFDTDANQLYNYKLNSDLEVARKAAVASAE